jgi:putative copper export protein
MRIALFLHLASMAFWLGGQLFLALVAVPALRGLDPVQRDEMFRKVGRAFGMVSIPALVVLLGTGGWMLVEYDLDVGAIPALRHKLELVGLVLFGTVVHVIAGARRMRRTARVASIATLLATLGVVWLATGY